MPVPRKTRRHTRTICFALPSSQSELLSGAPENITFEYFLEFLRCSSSQARHGHQQQRSAPERLLLLARSR
jgi:hypothetical protein